MAPRHRELERSINFVTCHDGLTLNDLVSYNHKHNDENGENNRDGSEDNRSWNCGVEGPSDDPAIEKLRTRQVKNFLTAVMLSGGVPMLVMGDEVRRSQQGNNNAYCQDNETSWFDWRLVLKHTDVIRFLRLLIERRRVRDVAHESRRESVTDAIAEVFQAWNGVKLNQPDWSPYSHSIAFTGRVRSERLVAHIILNAYWEALEFDLPILNNGAEKWRRWIDTALEPPDEICEWNREQPVPGATYRAGARSVVVLIASEHPVKQS